MILWNLFEKNHLTDFDWNESCDCKHIETVQLSCNVLTIMHINIYPISVRNMADDYNKLVDIWYTPVIYNLLIIICSKFFDNQSIIIPQNSYLLSTVICDSPYLVIMSLNLCMMRHTWKDKWKDSPKAVTIRRLFLFQLYPIAGGLSVQYKVSSCW